MSWPTLSPEFPPVNSGGLIEASARQEQFPPEWTMFPPVNSGGLIEAYPKVSYYRYGGRVSAGEFRRPH